MSNNSSAAGIPKDRVFSVFESFVQADQSTTRLYGGTGLGLTIVKSLVELMGGTIKIEEKATPGSLFRVRLFFQGEEGVRIWFSFTDQSFSPCFREKKRTLIKVENEAKPIEGLVRV